MASATEADASWVQIWHLAIVLAIILHYRAIFVAHTSRFEYSCRAPDAGMPVSLVVEGLVRPVWEILRLKS